MNPTRPIPYNIGRVFSDKGHWLKFYELHYFCHLKIILIRFTFRRFKSFDYLVEWYIAEDSPSPADVWAENSSSSKVFTQNSMHLFLVGIQIYFNL
jgi:hypothetical protein